MAILILLTFLVILSMIGLLIFSLLFQPLSWYWILSPIWISWILIVVAFLVFAPIAVYLKDKTGGRG